MMDAKYLAEIRARLDADRIPMKSDMEALLAEVERLTKENQGLRANSEVQESIISGGRNPADKEQIVRLTMDNAAKDQQIDTLKKALEIASMEVNVAFETLESHHVITMERKASGTQENIDAWIQKAKQAQEQEGKK